MEKLVVMRFDELAKRADAILGSKQVDFEFEGKTHFKVDRAEVLTWGTSVVNLLQRVFGEDSVHFKKFHAHFENFDRWESQFSDYRAIFRAAKEDYEGGYLFKVRSLIQAEVFDDALEQAAELLRAGYKDPACVVVGVTLETTLKELCTRNGIATGKLDKMNVDLCKTGVYNVGMQKQITAWADRRNKAAHGEWTAYNDADVGDMLRGVERVVAEYL